MSQSGSEPREPKRLFQGRPGNQVEVGLGFQQLTPNLLHNTDKWTIFPFMKCSLGSLSPASRRDAGESDVCLLGHPVDRLALGFWIQPHLAKTLHPSAQRGIDTGVRQTLTQDVQMLSLGTWHRGPGSPSPNLRPGGRALGSAPSPPDRGRGRPRHEGSGCSSARGVGIRGGIEGAPAVRAWPPGSAARPRPGPAGPRSPRPATPRSLRKVLQLLPRPRQPGSCDAASGARGPGRAEREGEVG